MSVRSGGFKWCLFSSHPGSLLGFLLSPAPRMVAPHISSLVSLTKPCLPIALASANCLTSSFTEEMEMSGQVLLFLFVSSCHVHGCPFSALRPDIWVQICPARSKVISTGSPPVPSPSSCTPSSSCRHPSSLNFYSPIGTQTGHQDFPS